MFIAFTTLRYWYDDVAEIFGCTQNEVASDCDYFIAQFGITNEKCRKWNKEFLVQQDYSKTYNNHGTIPTVETPEKYAEWHAMFYVADKYRQTKETVGNDYKTYDSWLKEYLPGKDGFWCFEFRSHVPLLPFLWDFTKTVESNPNPHYVIPKTLPKSMIEHSLGISLDMRYSAHFQQSNRYIRVQSAFVDKENIHKLVNEFHKPHTEFFDFYHEADGYRYGKKPAFFLYPTCDTITTFPDYALDKKDLLLKDYLTASNYLMGLSQDFEKCFKLSRDKQILYTRVCNDQNVPVQMYHWSEPENESGYEKSSTYGNMVVIKIFEVLISFKDDDYRFHGTASEAIDKKYFYVMNFDTMTNTMLNEFVEKILVHERDRKGSQDTTQEVEIYFNFVGKYAPPHFGEVTLTAEEQEELRKKEERKDRLHQNYLRCKANGKHREYEERTKSEKSKKMEEKKPPSEPRTWQKAYIFSQAACHSQSHREPPPDNEKECKMMKLEYIQNGDYLILNLALSEQPTQPICLKSTRPPTSDCKRLMPMLMKAAGISEQLKAADQMKWVGLMNKVKAQAEEVILAELICCN